jgi:hypothetical protein
MDFIGGYRNRLNCHLPFIDKFVDSLFKPLLDVVSHRCHMDFMPDFYIEELAFQVP